MGVLETLKLAVVALTATVSAVEGLSTAVRELWMTGKNTISAMWSSTAEEEKERLKTLSEYLVSLGYETNVVTVQSIDGYLTHEKPSYGDWNRVRKALHAALSKTAAILTDLKRETSDIILEDTYATLRSSLYSRVTLLDDLLAIPQPQSNEEIAALREINDRYKELITQLREAVKELNHYIKEVNKR